MRVIKSGRNIKGYRKKCEGYGCKNESQHIHHLDGDKKNNDVSFISERNLMLLCASCHAQYHERKAPQYDLTYWFHPHRIGMRIVKGANMLEEAYI